MVIFLCSYLVYVSYCTIGCMTYALSPIFCHSKCRAPQQSNGWEALSAGAKEWVLCGSALSTEERVSSNRICFFDCLIQSHIMEENEIVSFLGCYQPFESWYLWDYKFCLRGLQLSHCDQMFNLFLRHFDGKWQHLYYPKIILDDFLSFIWLRLFGSSLSLSLFFFFFFWRIGSCHVKLELLH